MKSIDTATTKKNSASQNFFLSDLLAAFSASFVILSLGAAFGVMSGRGALIGILSSGLIPILTAFISGSKIQCAGPTGPVTVITAGIVAIASDQFAVTGVSDAYVNFVLLLSAGFVFLFGILRLGKAITLIPKVIVSGFMTGIALIIAQTQLTQIYEYAHSDPETFLPKIIIVSLSTIVMFVWPIITNKYFDRWGRFLSGTLITLILMTVVSQMLSLPIPTIDLGLSGGNIFSSKIFSFAIWDHSFASYEALKTALIWSLQLAFVMSLDTLMTSVVMDQKTGHTTAKNQELLCQSISTSCMAFIGGIPGAQATVRSVLIFKEGAHSRWSSFFLGIFVLLQLFFFRDLIELVPTAVFIGIVLKIAYDIADWTPIRLYVNEIFSRHSPLLKKFTARHDEIKIYVTNREIAIIILTAGLTVVSNLFIAVATMTSLYYLGNKYFWPNNPIRDLQPQTETEGFIDED